MRIVFLGSGAFGIASLESLTMQHEVVLVVTQPDRPAGRGKVMTATPIALRAEELGVPVLKPEDVNEDSVRAQVRAHLHPRRPGCPRAGPNVGAQGGGGI